MANIEKEILNRLAAEEDEFLPAQELIEAQIHKVGVGGFDQHTLSQHNNC